MDNQLLKTKLPVTENLVCILFTPNAYTSSELTTDNINVMLCFILAFCLHLMLILAVNLPKITSNVMLCFILAFCLHILILAVNLPKIISMLCYVSY